MAVLEKQFTITNLSIIIQSIFNIFNVFQGPAVVLSPSTGADKKSVWRLTALSVYTLAKCKSEVCSVKTPASPNPFSNSVHTQNYMDHAAGL